MYRSKEFFLRGSVAPTALVERMQIRRAEMGLTINALIRRAEVDPGRLNRFVYHGKSLTPAELERIANVLGIDPAELRPHVAL